MKDVADGGRYWLIKNGIGEDVYKNYGLATTDNPTIKNAGGSVVSKRWRIMKNLLDKNYLT